MLAMAVSSVHVSIDTSSFNETLPSLSRSTSPVTQGVNSEALLTLAVRTGFEPILKESKSFVLTITLAN